MLGLRFELEALRHVLADPTCSVLGHEQDGLLASDGSECAFSHALIRTAVLESVRRTGRLVVAHEAVVDFGVGAEIAAWVAEHAFDALRGPIVRVGAAFMPVPFARSLERAYRPCPDDIENAVRCCVGRVAGDATGGSKP